MVRSLGTTDESQLDFAVAELRMLFTQDSDFIDISYSIPNHWGVIYAPQRRDIGYLVECLLFVRSAYYPEEMCGKLEFI